MSNRNSSTLFSYGNQIVSQQHSKSSFEHVVECLRLTPEQYATSSALREWVQRNRRFKYVPPDVLAAFGFKAGAEV